MSLPTALTAKDHERAYAYFNAGLFDGALPPCLITLGSGRFKGFFRANAFRHIQNHTHVDEIGMNPTAYTNLEDYLSTLVHEQVHLWQEHFGTPSRPPFHNREWANKMLEIGLKPSCAERGKSHRETGRKMDHAIVHGGPFELAFQDLLRTDFVVTYVHEPHPPRRAYESDEDEEKAQQQEEERKRKKRESKTRFTCPACHQNAWAKPEAKLACGECRQPLVSAQAHPNDAVENP
ncbi:hypothetical protein [Deinococcus multiflagellatus]|uniref:SprT domain-containing protein n=1 Tax=Deinococcus multiflagellatus TaxID=1656887 RepID=A0ABW1ZP40_9DEIO|nr:hypothetical protein [Deinococcus multiflagellatus]MBZ9715804.1 hypothetical protein [Deinococcus multiflagellatus]